jgi:hypothetical protein
MVHATHRLFEHVLGLAHPPQSWIPPQPLETGPHSIPVHAAVFDLGAQHAAPLQTSEASGQQSPPQIWSDGHSQT